MPSGAQTTLFPSLPTFSEPPPGGVRVLRTPRLYPHNANLVLPAADRGQTLLGRDTSHTHQCFLDARPPPARAAAPTLPVPTGGACMSACCAILTAR